MDKTRAHKMSQAVFICLDEQDENRSPIHTSLARPRSILKTIESKRKRAFKPSNIQWSRYYRTKKLKADGTQTYTKSILDQYGEDAIDCEQQHSTIDAHTRWQANEQLDRIDCHITELVKEMITNVDDQINKESDMKKAHKRANYWTRIFALYDKNDPADHETMAKTVLNVFNIDSNRIDFCKFLDCNTPDDELKTMIGDELVGQQIVLLMKNFRDSNHYLNRILARQNLVNTFEKFELELDTVRKTINEQVFGGMLYPPGKKLHVRIQSRSDRLIVLRYLWSCIEFRVSLSHQNTIQDIQAIKLLSKQTKLSDIRWILAGKIDPPLYDGELQAWPFEDEDLDILLAALDHILVRFEQSKPSLIESYDANNEEAGLMVNLDAIVRSGVCLCKELLMIKASEHCRIYRMARRQLRLEIDCWPRLHVAAVKLDIDPVGYPLPDSIRVQYRLNRQDNCVSEFLPHLDALLSQLKTGQPDCLITIIQAMRAFFDETFDRRDQFEDCRSMDINGPSIFDSKVMDMIEEFGLSGLRFRVQPFNGHRLTFRFLWSMVQLNVNHIDGKFEVTVRRLATSETHFHEIEWTVEGRQTPPLFDGEDQLWSFRQCEMPILAATTYRVVTVFRKHCQSEDNSVNVRAICDAMHDVTESARQMCLELLALKAKYGCHILPYFPPGLFKMQLQLWCVRSVALVDIEFDPIVYPSQLISPKIILGPLDESLQPKIAWLRATLDTGLAVVPGSVDYVTNLVGMVQLYLDDLRSRSASQSS